MKVPDTPLSAFAPATVANVSCGFDMMGFAVEATGDRVTLQTGVKHRSVKATGAYGHLLPLSWEANTATVAIQAMLHHLQMADLPLQVSIQKDMPLGSGMGSSAASAAAAVFALNQLLGQPLTLHELVPFAMEGEKVASGGLHADNVAPALLGGFVLIRSYEPLDLIQLPCPSELFAVVVHPQVILQTYDARRILRQEIPLKQVVQQTANVAGFVSGLLQGDYQRMGRSMSDLLAEPLRIRLIPGYTAVKQAAIEQGAIGCGISGSGPSVFALCQGLEVAQRVASQMQTAFNEVDLPSEAYVSSLNIPGARLV